MHNLAIALKKNGHLVSGSDDEIFEPSKSRLKEHGLLPNRTGWDTSLITKDLDLVILGMHARKDNPELLKAQEMNLEINSYPEFIYNQSVNKTRVVIAGSHGKTTTTSMILHVLKKLKKKFDFMVGAQIRDFDTMVQLSDAPLIILEGDEYFSSPVDMKAKFLWYKPHIAVITGIAWDHINVYPTKESYNQAFVDFIKSMHDDAYLYYFSGDIVLTNIVKKIKRNLHLEGYKSFPVKIENGETKAIVNNQSYSLNVFGDHNIQNMQAARMICHKLGISDDQFFNCIGDFGGASNRLELLAKGPVKRVFRDFAHSPSKLMATVKACKDQFQKHKLLAVMELHTFSSLNKDFLTEYKDCMNAADKALVYYDPQVIEHKKLSEISADTVKNAFGFKNLIVVTDKSILEKIIKENAADCETILLMSSGNFGGLDRNQLAKDLVNI